MISLPSFHTTTAAAFSNVSTPAVINISLSLRDPLCPPAVTNAIWNMYLIEISLNSGRISKVFGVGGEVEIVEGEIELVEILVEG
ncbi:hypothetical protein ACSBR2_025876 [Camellia fascicularis]